jgi:CRP-like cAMP-binding protein
VKLSVYEKTYSVSSIIYREGESPDRLLLLQKGKVYLSKSRGEKRFLCRLIADHGFFGLEEFLLGSPFEQEAAAAQESVILELPRHLAESYLLANPKFLLELSEYLARRAANLEKSAALSRRSEGGRLAAALWMVFSENGNSGAFLAPEELGRLISSATGFPESRAEEFLTELERLEILGKSEKGFFLKSAEKLFRYADYLEDKEHFG